MAKSTLIKPPTLAKSKVAAKPKKLAKPKVLVKGPVNMMPDMLPEQEAHFLLSEKDKGESFRSIAKSGSKSKSSQHRMLDKLYRDGFVKY